MNGCESVLAGDESGPTAAVESADILFLELFAKYRHPETFPVLLAKSQQRCR